MAREETRAQRGFTYDDLLALAQRFEDKTLETVTGKRFTVGIYRDCPFFTPESSGFGQSEGRGAAERFIERYNEIGSLRPGDYARVSRNASYYIGMLLEAPAVGDERWLTLDKSGRGSDESPTDAAIGHRSVKGTRRRAET